MYCNWHNAYRPAVEPLGGNDESIPASLCHLHGQLLCHEKQGWSNQTRFMYIRSVRAADEFEEG